jgi:ABC-type transport system involved in multi-copper enzyme maturation permease subunit
MKTLVAKEVRMLLPVFAAALLLAVAPMWLLPAVWSGDEVMKTVMPLFCFGTLLMGLTSFGREFSMGTFPLLLSLPLTRRRVWWVKISVLCVALAGVFMAGYESLRLWMILYPRPENWFEGVTLMNPLFSTPFAITFLVVMTSGLWTTLLLRQIVGALWIALLAPFAIFTVILWNRGSNVTIEVALSVYAVAGFWLARRLFYRAQEVAWTGGEVSLPELRTARAAAVASGRNRRPMTALMGKELRLYQVPLAGMAGLFVMHLMAIALRKVLHGLPEYDGSMFSNVLQMFGGLWILVPVVTGGINVADERRMGTFEAHLCLPISRRRQFFIKFLVSFLISGGLSVLLLWAAEGIAMFFHAPAGFGGQKEALEMEGLRMMSYCILAISLMMFYAATLSRSVLQTIVTAVGVTIVFETVCGTIAWVIRQYDGMFWWSPLFVFMVFLALVVTGARLAFGNYGMLLETRRVWMRNVRGLGLAIVFATVLTEFMIHRTWEYLTPMEPPHGPARLSLAQAPRLSFNNSLSVLIPGGPAWWEPITYQLAISFEPFGDNLPIRLGREKWVGLPGKHFLAGTNWMAESGSMVENAAIRGDGTLWVSAKTAPPFYRRKAEAIKPPAPMEQFGHDTDWKDLARVGEHERVLLKQDGTLWSWGTNHVDHPLGLKNQEPQRWPGGGWSRMLATPNEVFVWKENGEAWIVVDSNWRPEIAAGGQKPLGGTVTLARWAWFDHQKLRSVAGFIGMELVVREDGTLWTYGPMNWTSRHGQMQLFNRAPLQIGTERDWVSVAADSEMVVTLKADGTLWQWGDREPYFLMLQRGQAMERQLTRLGIHSDWVALGGGNNGICSLAADGSVWWWSAFYYNTKWLAPSRKPMAMGNIFVTK